VLGTKPPARFITITLRGNSARRLFGRSQDVADMFEECSRLPPATLRRGAACVPAATRIFVFLVVPPSCSGADFFRKTIGVRRSGESHLPRPAVGGMMTLDAFLWQGHLDKAYARHGSVGAMARARPIATSIRTQGHQLVPEANRRAGALQGPVSSLLAINSAGACASPAMGYGRRQGPLRLPRPRPQFVRISSPACAKATVTIEGSRGKPDYPAGGRARRRASYPPRRGGMPAPCRPYFCPKRSHRLHGLSRLLFHEPVPELARMPPSTLEPTHRAL